ncbi:MAG: hypothetical protein IJ711_03755 [Lachnospiraceae bacterium]|nr:hypothetical protein [Lachnospiraceae bacterium]
MDNTLKTKIEELSKYIINNPNDQVAALALQAFVSVYKNESNKYNIQGSVAASSTTHLKPTAFHTKIYAIGIVEPSYNTSTFHMAPQTHA